MFEGQPRARRKKKYTGQHADRLERRDADAEVAHTGRGIGLTIRDRDDFLSPTGSRQLLQRSLDTGLTDKRVEQPGLADSPGRDAGRVRETRRELCGPGAQPQCRLVHQRRAEQGRIPRSHAS